MFRQRVQRSSIAAFGGIVFATYAVHKVSLGLRGCFSSLGSLIVRCSKVDLVACIHIRILDSLCVLFIVWVFLISSFEFPVSAQMISGIEE